MSGLDEQTAVDGEPAETVDALPVLAHEASVVGGRVGGADVVRSSGALPAVQAAAAAAGGFVAGAAVVGLVVRRRRPAATKGRRGRGALRRGRRGSDPAGELVQIVGSRSLLVDVHLLGGRG